MEFFFNVLKNFNVFLKDRKQTYDLMCGVKVNIYNLKAFKWFCFTFYRRTMEIIQNVDPRYCFNILTLNGNH